MDKKLTDKEIIKALECKIKFKCNECPYFDGFPCSKCHTMLIAVLDLINRLQAEIRVKNKLLDKAEEKFEQYEKREVEWGKTFEKQFKEIESLKQNLEEAHIDIRCWKAENEKMKLQLSAIHSCRGYEEHIKAEAYKEFAEKLENRILSMLTTATLEEKEIICACIGTNNNVLKELVGEDK